MMFAPLLLLWLTITAPNARASCQPSGGPPLWPKVTSWSSELKHYARSRPRPLVESPIAPGNS